MTELVECRIKIESEGIRVDMAKHKAVWQS